MLLGSLCLDFLAIHPVADGNGRLARLLTIHELFRAGYGIARYVSLEQRIFETRNSYYAALRASQRNWNDAAHDVWPWIEYFAGIVAGAYESFEEKVSGIASTQGMSKQEIARRHVQLMPAGSVFRFRDLRSVLPGISDQTLRLALDGLRDGGLAAPSGRGAGARWTRTVG